MINDEQLNFVGRIAQKALIYNNNLVLLVRHAGGAELWELPGGRLHREENPVDGLRREIREELGISVLVDGVLAAEQFVMKRTGEPHVVIVYKAHLEKPDQPLVPLTSEIVDAVWVTKDSWKNYPSYDCYERVLRDYFAPSGTLQ